GDSQFADLLINTFVKMLYVYRGYCWQGQKKRHQTWILVGGLLKDLTEGFSPGKVCVSGRCMTMCHHGFTPGDGG
ncbi:hypothetical protein DN195_26955, partial [Salmonella enterica subsp. enterica serovar Panama]|nr:hypothetical protein [Salmonella enterica subsp. enterica serovar Panama]